jgi:hypothetical protein
MTDFFGRLKSGAGKVAFEAEKMARVNRAQGELAKIKSQIEEQFHKLGQLYYSQQANLDAAAPAFAEICQVVAGLEEQASHKEEEIHQINAETYNPQGATPSPMPAATPAQFTPMPAMGNTMPSAPAALQTKACPSCGREMAVTVKFCPDCGTKTS